MTVDELDGATFSFFQLLFFKKKGVKNKSPSSSVCLGEMLQRWSAGKLRET